MESNQIIVALDGMSHDQALTLAWTLASRVWGFKINDLAWIYGLEFVRALKCLGRVFVDAKLHDDPARVGNVVSRLSEANVDMISIHAAGGFEMIKAAIDNSDDGKIIATTMLPSCDCSTAQQVYNKTIEESIWDLAHLASDAGVHGVHCASDDLPMLRHLPVLKVASSAREVKVFGGEIFKNVKIADYLTVSHTITASSDPLIALENLMEEIW